MDDFQPVLACFSIFIFREPLIFLILGYNQISTKIEILPDNRNLTCTAVYCTTSTDCIQGKNLRFLETVVTVFSPGLKTPAIQFLTEIHQVHELHIPNLLY